MFFQTIDSFQLKGSVTSSEYIPSQTSINSAQGGNQLSQQDINSFSLEDITTNDNENDDSDMDFIDNTNDPRGSEYLAALQEELEAEKANKTLDDLKSIEQVTIQNVDRNPKYSMVQKYQHTPNSNKEETLQTLRSMRDFITDDESDNLTKYTMKSKVKLKPTLNSSNPRHSPYANIYFKPYTFNNLHLTLPYPTLPYGCRYFELIE